jgi:hypothetical protein
METQPSPQIPAWDPLRWAFENKELFAGGAGGATVTTDQSHAEGENHR